MGSPHLRDDVGYKTLIRKCEDKGNFWRCRLNGRIKKAGGTHKVW